MRQNISLVISYRRAFQTMSWGWSAALFEQWCRVWRKGFLRTEMTSWFRRLRHLFSIHQVLVIQRECIWEVKRQLSGLDHSVLIDWANIKQQQQTDGALTHVAEISTPRPCCKGHSESPFGNANDFIGCVLTKCGWRCGCFLLTPPRSNGKKVSLSLLSA